jgi:hypothetical protein
MYEQYTTLARRVSVSKNRGMRGAIVLQSGVSANSSSLSSSSSSSPVTFVT